MRVEGAHSLSRSGPPAPCQRTEGLTPDPAQGLESTLTPGQSLHMGPLLASGNGVPFLLGGLGSLPGLC